MSITVIYHAMSLTVLYMTSMTHTFVHDSCDTYMTSMTDT